MNILFQIILALLLCSSTSSALLLNGTAAKVNKKLITIRDVYFYRMVSRFRQGNSDRSLETGEVLRKSIQKATFEEMVFIELRSLQFEGMGRERALAAIENQRKKFPKLWKSLARDFGVSENDVRERLYMSLQVESFLQKKVETLTPIVTQREVEQYYEQNRSKFKSDSLEAMRPSIELILKKDRMSKSLEEWIRYLKDKYGVTNHFEG